MQLPNETGFYLWYILDLNYLDVGVVQILQDDKEHLTYLASLTGEKRKHFYVYKSGYITFTMYHQAVHHLPPMDEDSKPQVDGWIPFDFRTIGLVREQPTPSLLPTATNEQLRRWAKESSPPKDIQDKPEERPW